MGAGQRAYLAGDGPNLGQAAPVGTNPQIQDPPPDFALDHVLETLGDPVAGKLLGQLLGHLILQPIQALVPFRLEGVLLQDVAHPSVEDGLDSGVQLLGLLGIRRNLQLFLAHLGDQFVNLVNGNQVGVKGFLDAFEDDLLGHLIRAGLHHHNGVPGAGDHHIQLAVGDFGVGGVDDKPAVIIGNPAGADRAAEGQLREGQGRRGAQHPQNLRRVFLVHGQDGQDDLDFVVQSLGKEGADGAVGEAGGEDGFLAGASFPAEKAAGYPAGRVEAFLKLHRQGQKVDVGPGFIGHHRRRQDDGIAVGQDDGTVGLKGQLSRFHHQLFVSDDSFYNSSVRHNKVT